MLRTALAVILLAASPAAADQSTGAIRVVVEQNLGAATVEISSEREPERRWSARAEPGAPSSVTGLPPGTYQLTVTPATGGSAAAEVSVSAGEVVWMAFTASGGVGQLAVADRTRVSQATVLTARHLRQLPAGSGLFGLLDAASPYVITDRMDTGGLSLGSPARVGSRGASWTRSNIRLGAVDIGRGHGGPDQIAWWPDLNVVDEVAVSSGMATPDLASPGAVVTIVPRGPGPLRHRALDVSFTAPGMVASNDSTAAPSIGRVESWVSASAEHGGPVRPRIGAFLSGSISALRARERGGETSSTSVASAFWHAVANPGQRTQWRLLGALQRAGRPSGSWPRGAGVSETDVLAHVQAGWEHHTSFGARLALSAAYQRGSFKQSSRPSPVVAVDRAFDGPIPFSTASPVTGRTDVHVSLSAPETHGHAVEVGVALARASSSFDDAGPVTVAELIDGLPARVWVPQASSAASKRRVFHAAAYLTDQLRIRPNLTLAVGARVGKSTGSASGAERGVTWPAVLPRLSVRWKTRVADLFAGYGRYQDELPLQVLAYGDPGAPVLDVYRWDDANSTGTFEASELAALVARAGTGAAVASIDPDLRAPHTDELTFGAERALGARMHIAVTGAVRRERSIVRSVNAGVPAEAYRVLAIADQGEDWDSPTDDRPLPVFDRLASSFGQDQFVLTNPAGEGASYDGLEILWRLNGVRWWSFAGASAYRAEGSGSNRGFGSGENDQGLIGELLETPNARSHPRGRLFFDRAYVLKWSTGFEAPRDITAAVTARYQDGQPFSRLVVVPGLAQGPELVSAYFAGRTRFTFTATVDARLEKRFAVGARRAAVRLDLYNLTNLALEVEENPLTGPEFRRTTAVQPPLTVRLGFGIDF